MRNFMNKLRFRAIRLSTKLTLLTVSLFLVFFAAMALTQTLVMASRLLQDAQNHANSSFREVRDTFVEYGYIYDSSEPFRSMANKTDMERQDSMKILASQLNVRTFNNAFWGYHQVAVMIGHAFTEPEARTVDYLSNVSDRLAQIYPESVADRQLLIDSVRNRDVNFNWIQPPEKFTPSNGLGSLTFAVSRWQESVTRYDGTQSALTVFVFYYPLRMAVQALWRTWLITLIIAALFMLLFAWLIRRLVAQPIVSLSRTAELMAGRHIVQDSTYSKRSDEIGLLYNSLNEMAGDLNRTISQLEMTNRDLAAANVRLSNEMERERALDQRRRAFIAGASHELKTPLALISGYAETLLHDINPERRQDYAERIMNSAMHMGRLVKDLLLSARLEDPVYTLRINRFSLSRLVRDTISDFTQAIEEKELVLSVILAAEDETIVEADEERIRQVILNLISNAVRYTSPGGALIVTVDKIDTRVQFCVENEGAAIPEDELSKIWDLFYRPDTARSTNTGGSGIGLAVVRTILEQHNADYGVVNTETGIRFYFELSAAQTNNIGL